MYSRLKLPIPPGFVITTEACNEYLKAQQLSLNHPDKPADDVALHQNKQLIDEYLHKMKEIELVTGRAFGGGKSDTLPLLVSVRVSTSLPSELELPAILNLGMNAKIVKDISLVTNNPKFAYNLYMTFMKDYGTYVLGIESECYDRIIKEMLSRRNISDVADFIAADLEIICNEFEQIAKYPTDCYEQLKQAVTSMFESWNNKNIEAFRDENDIPDFGLAVVVQSMVYGNMNCRSCAGEVSYRDPTTGEKEIVGCYLYMTEAISESMQPRSISSMKNELCSAYEKLVAICKIVEDHYRDVMKIEFVVENGHLYILEARPVDRSLQCGVKIANDFVKEGLITEREAVMRIFPKAMDLLVAGNIKVVANDTVDSFIRLFQYASKFKSMTIVSSVSNMDEIVQAKKYGSEGIILNTDNMIFNNPRQDSKDLISSLLSCNDVTERRKILKTLQPLLQADFLEVYKAFPNSRITFQFVNNVPQRLPSVMEKAGEMVGMGNDGDISMCNLHGARLCVLMPELLQTFLLALVNACTELFTQGISNLSTEVLIPSVISERELDIIIPQIRSSLVPLRIGCIASPRLLIRADTISKKDIDFIIFDSTELTSLIYGDTSANHEWVNEYLKAGIMSTNPFQSIDMRGVGYLMQLGLRKIRLHNRSIKVGIKGVHVNDTNSIQFFEQIGVDFISCTPDKLPSSTVACAQAHINTMSARRREENQSFWDQLSQEAALF